MIFNRTVNHQFSTRLNLSGTLLENIEEIKLLVVCITNNLSWTKNTEELCKKAFARISMITKLMYVCVSTEDLLEIYTLFIRSKLESCCVVWHSSLTLEQQDNIERVQRVCLKVILRDNWVSYDAALEMTGLEKLINRREDLCLNFATKCTTHPKHKLKFPLNNPSELVPPNGHAHHLRERERYVVNPAKTETYRQSALPYMQRLLNKNSNPMDQPQEELVHL